MKAQIGFLAMVVFPLMLYPQVQPEWSMVFNGTDDYIDKGLAIALDSSDNVFVGGMSVSITNGAPDYVIIKYSPGGELKWSYTYDGTGSYEDFLTAIATDAQGNVYATGSSYEGPSGNDFVTIKISASGAFEWKSVYKGLDVDNDDAATDIVVGEDGYVYVTGASAGFSSSMWTDFATLKLSPAGDTVWTRRLGGSGMPNDRAMAVAVDPDGCVYVTGYTEGDVSQRYNYTTVKYKPDGDTAWVRNYNGTGSDEDRAYAIAVDSEKSVIVTGTSWGLFYDDFATVKYDSNGVQQWVSRYNGPANSYDKAWDLKIDGSGNIYVTGESGGDGGNYDYCTIKYNPDGGEEWVRRYNGPDNFNDFATSLAIDGAGYVHVTGYSENAPSPYISVKDIVTLTYRLNGTEMPPNRFDGPGNFHDYGLAIACDRPGNVYVVGRTETYGQQNSSDILTIKYAGTEGMDEREPVDPLVLYPNPSSGMVFMQSDEEILRIEVCHVSGQQFISENSCMNGNDTFRVDVSGYPAGLYFFRIYTETSTFVKKVLIK